MTPTAPQVVGRALAEFRRTWLGLARTDIACRLIAAAVLTPLTLALLRWAMWRTGAGVVADTDIAEFFFTSRQGIVALLVVGALFVAMFALELACVMAVARAAARGRHLTPLAALAFGARRAMPVLRLATNLVLRFVAAVIPFSLAIGLAYWGLLGSHDINYYLAQRPPEFLVALAIAAVVIAGFGTVVVSAITRWAVALPIVLFERAAPRAALAEAARRSSGRRGAIAGALVIWAGIGWIVLATAAWLPSTLGRALAPGFSGSLELLLAFISVFALFWAALVLLALVANTVLLAVVLLTLYSTVSESAVPSGDALDDDPASARRLPVALRATAVVLAGIAVVTFALLVAGTAGRARPVLVIAHRGASSAAPENTLAAFRLGAELGADFNELDVQETSDGEVVVVHDSDLMKIGGSPLKIWESTAAALRAVDIGSHKGPQFSAERVPLLAETLSDSKGRVRVLVELKSYGHDQQLEARVAGLVEQAGTERDTVFMSMDHAMARRMKTLRPSWRVGVLAAKALGDLRSLGADFLAVEANMATRRFVRQAHAVGQDVYVWTVNDPIAMLSAIQQGVDGLITDKPDLARRVIDWRAGLTTEQRIMTALLVRLGVRDDVLPADIQ